MSNASFQRNLAAWLLDHRLMVIAMVLVVSMVLGYQLRNPSVLFQKHDPEALEDTGGNEWVEHANRFGEGELVMLVIEARDLFTADVLGYIRSTSNAIANIEKVRKVVSLTSLPQITLTDGSLYARQLFPEIPDDPVLLAEKKRVVLSNPLWVNNIISSDGSTTVLNVFLPPLMRGSLDAAQTIETIHSLTKINRPESLKVYMTGLSPMFMDSMQSARQDFRKFFWMTWGLMTAFLYFAFRTVRGVIIPLAITFLAVYWTLGLMVVADQTISAVGVMLPTLIGVICFSDAIHVLTHYYEQIQRSSDKRTILMNTMEHMITACFLTSATTATAFGSLMAADLSSIRQFGLWAAIGILLGYLLIITLTPIMLSWLPLPKHGVKQHYEKSYIGVTLQKLARFARSQNRWVAIIAIVITMACLAAAPRLHFETSLTEFLPDRAPAMQGYQIAKEKLTGFGSVEIELKGPIGCFEEPWALKEIQQIEQYLENQPEVGFARTIRDLLQWAHTIAEETDTDLLAHPKARGLIAEYYFLFKDSKQSALINSLVTEACDLSNISARLRVSGAGEQVTLIEDLSTHLENHLDERLSFTITGDANRFARQIESVLRSLVSSFGTTLLIITLLMGWLMRSFKGTLIAMIPNLFPVLLTFGIMGALDISLNFATIMIASIAIGIAVDDTIHFLVRYQRELKASLLVDSAIDHTLLHSGRAITFTSITIASGCILFVFSDFAPNRNFGFLMAFIMVAALMTDLLLLPYLLKKWQLQLANGKSS